MTQLDIESPGAYAADVRSALRGLLTYRGARVRKSANQTGANYTGAGATIAWATEDRDTDAFFTVGTSATNFVVPAGVSKVRLLAHAVAANFTGGLYMFLQIQKAGVLFNGTASSITPSTGTGTWRVTTKTDVVDVVEGDTFSAYLLIQTDTSVDITTDSFFSIQVIQ